MPTYEYQCAKCSYEFEKFQSMSASVLRKCPECGKLALKRLIGTGAGVIFKGSGFYETDYRSESYKNTAKAETGGEKAAKKETKAETNTGSGASTLQQSSVRAGSPQWEKKPSKPKNEKKPG